MYINHLNTRASRYRCWCLSYSKPVSLETFWFELIRPLPLCLDEKVYIR